MNKPKLVSSFLEKHRTKTNAGFLIVSTVAALDYLLSKYLSNLQSFLEFVLADLLPVLAGPTPIFIFSWVIVFAILLLLPIHNSYVH